MSMNVRLLVTRVQKISDWFMLGVYLGVPNEELNKIDQRFSASHGVERCKAELFDLWLRRNPSARWDDVASALDQLNELTLASELRQLQLCQISSPALSSTPNLETATDGEPAQVIVEVSKLAVKKFSKLESKFASLVCNVKSMVEKKRVTPGKITQFFRSSLKPRNTQYKHI